jgi:hypothetical protein
MTDFEEITKNILQFQYDGTNIANLLLNKATVYNKYIGSLTASFRNEILNYNTCTAEALDYIWGKLFKISRVFKNKDGVTFSLTDDQFREIIKIKAFCTDWDGSINTANNFLRELFGERGVVYIIDNQTMNISTYVFKFELEDWEKLLFTKYDILPRPAGVNTEILQIFDRYFGLREYDDYIDNPLAVGFTEYEEEQEGKTLNYETIF